MNRKQILPLNGKRIKALSMTIAILIPTQLVLLTFFLTYFFTENPFNFNTSDKSIENSMKVYLVFALLDIILTLVSIVLFLMWQRRAFENLERVYFKDLPCSPTQSSFYFFIPILNLYFPLKNLIYIKDKYYKLSENLIERSSKPLSNKVLIIWWFMAVIFVVAFFWIRFNTEVAYNIFENSTMRWLLVLIYSFNISFLTLSIPLITSLSRAENAFISFHNTNFKTIIEGIGKDDSKA